MLSTDTCTFNNSQMVLQVSFSFMPFMFNCTKRTWSTSPAAGQNTCSRRIVHCSLVLLVLLPTASTARPHAHQKEMKKKHFFTRHCRVMIHLHGIYLHKATLQGSSPWPSAARSQTEAWRRRSWNARLQRGQAAGFLVLPPHAAKCRMSSSSPRRTPSSSSHDEASSVPAKMRSRKAMASLSCPYTCCDARSLSHLSFLCQ